ncbi:MAG: DUF6261 family protein [Odoribacteraceae bacterium]|jgi:tRNA isopentenyl-2-thiomethyl-A-37 hydroxylase MiaE|nr:DUF6261 family protein [Odoribacteraceae bacterium]
MKDKITRINTRVMRHETFAQYAARIIAAVDKHGPGSLGLEASSDELKAAFTIVLLCLDYINKSGLTAKLKDQDKVRDELIRGLTALIKSYLHHTDEALREAAAQLMLILDHYWSIPSRSYDDETTAIDDMFRELDLPAQAARVALLSIAPQIANFRAANERFKSLMDERDVEVAQCPAISMKEARAIADAKLSDMLDRLESIIVLNGIDFSEELAAFVPEYEAITKRYKHILALERGRRKAHHEDAEEEIEDETEDAEDTPVEDQQQ